MHGMSYRHDYITTLGRFVRRLPPLEKPFRACEKFFPPLKGLEALSRRQPDGFSSIFCFYLTGYMDKPCMYALRRHEANAEHIPSIGSHAKRTVKGEWKELRTCHRSLLLLPLLSLPFHMSIHLPHYSLFGANAPKGPPFSPVRREAQT